MAVEGRECSHLLEAALSAHVWKIMNSVHVELERKTSKWMIKMTKSLVKAEVFNQE